jgi:hypothetical protein
MRISRPIAATVLAVTALGGGLAGALLLGPASADPSSSATTDAATTDAATTDAAASDAATTDAATTDAAAGDAANPAPAAAACGNGLAAVAEAIGVSTADLRAALRDGQTLAEIARANDVEPQAVIDVLVANGTERLDAAVAAGLIDQATADERKAGLPDRAANLVNGELEHGVRRHQHPRATVALRTAADTIGIDVRDLVAGLRDGQTLAQVAEANGVDPQAVIDALVARSTERITKVVNGDAAWQRC